jgi:hypothetical protein
MKREKRDWKMDKVGVSEERLRDVTMKLFNYCRANEWAGYDPYDALNSRLLKRVPFLDSKLPRLALTQLLKRSPVNLRPLLGIPKTVNPKALAVFIKAELRLMKAGMLNDESVIDDHIIRLKDLRSEGVPYYCWGYSFPWQTRGVIVPRGAPNLVCTVFAADALLDIYETMRRPGCLDMARSSAEYLLRELYWEEDNSAGFSYPTPGLKLHIYNADLLGAALLCRVYSNTRDARFLGPALEAARSAAGQQNEDGSWYYGEMPAARWIDNFHTGYNLLALRDISGYAGTGEFSERIKRGLDFYRSNFFREDGAPKYFHDRTYPIDIHCVAQSIITLVSFKDFDDENLGLAASVLQWALSRMWDERGFFYYQAWPLFTNRLSYMRWSQAWMLYAMATMLADNPQDI